MNNWITLRQATEYYWHDIVLRRPSHVIVGAISNLMWWKKFFVSCRMKSAFDEMYLWELRATRPDTLTSIFVYIICPEPQALTLAGDYGWMNNWLGDSGRRNVPLRRFLHCGSWGCNSQANPEFWPAFKCSRSWSWWISVWFRDRQCWTLMRCTREGWGRWDLIHLLVYLYISYVLNLRLSLRQATMDEWIIDSETQEKEMYHFEDVVQ